MLTVDPSAGMLAISEERTTDERVRYLRSFAEDLTLPTTGVDLKDQSSSADVKVCGLTVGTRFEVPLGAAPSVGQLVSAVVFDRSEMSSFRTKGGMSTTGHVTR